MMFSGSNRLYIFLITSKSSNMVIPIITGSITRQPADVLLYILLYAAFLGSVSQPQPLGAFHPMECRRYRLTEVLAASLLLKEGFLYPNFIQHRLLGMTISGTVLTAINLAEMFFSFRYSRTAVTMYSQIKHVSWLRPVDAIMRVHFMISIGLCLFVDIIPF